MYISHSQYRANAQARARLDKLPENFGKLCFVGGCYILALLCFKQVLPFFGL